MLRLDRSRCPRNARAKGEALPRDVGERATTPRRTRNEVNAFRWAAGAPYSVNMHVSPETP